jgi:lysophospholipase L1-like esterase
VSIRIGGGGAPSTDRARLAGSLKIKSMAQGTTYAAPVMTSAPTVTQGTSVSAGLTVTILPTAAVCRWSGPLIASFKSGAFTPKAHTIGSTGGLQQARYAQVAFDFTDRYLDVDYRYYTTLKYRLWINEQAATADFVAPPAATNDTRQYLKIDLGSDSRAEPRRVVIEFEDPTNALSVYAFRAVPLALLTAPTINSPRVLVVGDSYARGFGYTGGSNEYDAYPRMLGRLMGWADLWNTNTSWGGTGLVHANDATIGPYGLRVGYDVVPHNPDLVIIQGSVNDAIPSVSLVGPALTSYVQQLRASHSDVEIAVVSPLMVGAPTTAQSDVAAAMKATATSLALPYADVMGLGAFTGTGGSASPNGTGNADWARRGDVTHPTPAGANALARVVAGELGRVLGMSSL